MEKKWSIALALSMPEDDHSGVCDKIFNKISVEDLHREHGVKILTDYTGSFLEFAKRNILINSTSAKVI